MGRAARDRGQAIAGDPGRHSGGLAMAETDKSDRPSLPFVWKIDRKVYASGVGGVLAWLLLAGISTWAHFDLAAWAQPYINLVATGMGINPPPSAQGLLAIAIGTIIGYVVPAAYSDIYRRINTRIIAEAIADGSTPNTKDVTLAGVA